MFADETNVTSQYPHWTDYQNCTHSAKLATEILQVFLEYKQVICLWFDIMNVFQDS